MFLILVVFNFSNISFKFYLIQTLRAFRRVGTHVRRSACPWPGVPEEKAVSEQFIKF